MLAHQALELLEPRPGGQTQFLQTVLPDIHVQFFLERKAEARDVVIEQRGAHDKAFLVEQNPVRRRNEAEWFTLESRATVEAAAVQGLVCVQLSGNEREFDRIVVHQVPGVGSKLVFDLVNEAGWPKEHQFALAPEAESQ